MFRSKSRVTKGSFIQHRRYRHIHDGKMEILMPSENYQKNSSTLNSLSKIVTLYWGGRLYSLENFSGEKWQKLLEAFFSS